jgi:hypothetical protein
VVQVKIVFASTPSQEEEISGLVRYIYSNVFPLYFTEDEVYEFEQLKVLDTMENQVEVFGTLKDAFKVMACMQTLISILESTDLDDQYSTLFSKNVSHLQEFGLFFPFEYEQFVVAKRMYNHLLSVNTKVANELLI